MRVTRFPKADGRNKHGSFMASWQRLARSLAALAITAPALFAVSAGSAADQTASYPSMAPVDAYLMDRGQEIALARSAAPESISKNATILVLTRTGYETAVTGSNGFVCMVSRSFSGAPDWPERWNPEIRAAECQNPQAARSIAPLAKLRTAMTLAGRSDAEIMARIKTALRTREIPPLAPGAMSYMMSKASYLSDDGDHDMAHVMFFIPFKDGDDWGANVPGSPIFGGNYWFATPDHAAETAALPPLSVVLLGVCTWSDGTSAPAHQM